MWARGIEVDVAGIETVVAVRLSTFWDRLALFIAAMAKGQAGGLTAGIEPLARTAVEAAVARLAAAPSSERQGQLALEFVAPHDVGNRLRRLLQESSPELRREMLEHLPAYQRLLVSEFEGAAIPSGPPSPLLRAVAERLVREATR